MKGILERLIRELIYLLGLSNDTQVLVIWGDFKGLGCMTLLSLLFAIIRQDIS